MNWKRREKDKVQYISNDKEVYYKYVNVPFVIMKSPCQDKDVYAKKRSYYFYLTKDLMKVI